MVVAKTMLDTPLELSNISTPILTGMNSTPMALSARPLSRVDVSGVEPVDPISMPETLPVLAAIPASSRPRLHPITIILLIDPITLIPPTHVVVIHAAAGALSVVEFALVDISIAVDTHPGARIRPFLRLGLGANGPEDWRRGAAGGRGGGGGEEIERERAAEGEIEGKEEGGGKGECGEEIKEEGVRVEEEEVERREREEEEEAEVGELEAEGGFCGVIGGGGVEEEGVGG